jgi:WD40 repeat protein
MNDSPEFDPESDQEPEIVNPNPIPGVTLRQTINLLGEGGHEDEVYSIAWSPEGKTLATGSGDNTIRLWDSKTARMLRTLEGHGGDVNTIAWSSDGLMLASCSDDHTILMWDPETGQVQ